MPNIVPIHNTGSITLTMISRGNMKKYLKTGMDRNLLARFPRSLSRVLSPLWNPYLLIRRKLGVRARM